MKKLKYVLALLLTCCLLLSACGGGGGSSGSTGGTPTGSGGQGRYVESDITPPGAGEEQQLYSFLAADGTLVCYTHNLAKRYESTDNGESWTESDGPGALNPDIGNIWGLSLLPDGTLLAAISDAMSGSVSAMVKIAPDGTTHPFAVPGFDELAAAGGMYVDMMQVLSADRLLLSYTGGMSYVGGTPEDDSVPGGDEPGDGNPDTPPPATGDDPDAPGTGDDSDDSATGDDSDDSGAGGIQWSAGGQESFVGLVDLNTGEVIADFGEWFGRTAATDGDKLYLLDYYGEIQTYSLADGKPDTADTLSIPVDEFAFNLSMTAKEGALYVLDGKQLIRLSPGTPNETVLDGSAYAFSDPSVMTGGLLALNDGSFVVLQASQTGSRLYKYSWDPDATLDPAKTLKVWSLEENSILRAAISALRQSRPDILVEYEVALSGQGGMTAEDAIKNLNTRLLNGDGPDVMLLDGCPVDSYAAKGMLMNLADLVDSSDIFENLASAFKSDNGTFVLPLNFQLPVLIGNQSTLGGTTTLDDLIALIQSGNGPLADTGDDVFASIPESERPVLTFSDLREAFDLLWNSGAGEVVKDGQLDSDALGQLLSALQTIAEKYKLENGGGAPTGALAMSSAGGAVATVTGSPIAYMSQRALLGGYTATDMQLMQVMMEPEGSSYTSFPGLTDGAFIPYGLAAINADTEKTELATVLLEALLSEQVQGTRSGAGFPVTRAGMEKQISDIDETMREYQNSGFEFDYQPLVDMATRPILSDDILTEAVWAAAEKLCNGGATLEGAVGEIEQNLKNYLAERQ